MDTKKDKAISRENRAAKERAKDVGEAARIADHAIEGEAGEWIAEALPVGYVMECLVRHEKEGTAPEWTDGPNQTAARMVLQRAFLRQAGGDGARRSLADAGGDNRRQVRPGNRDRRRERDSTMRSTCQSTRVAELAPVNAGEAG